MDRFTVSQIDPIQYKDQILKLWEEYLPGTPPGRLEWMHLGNPAGSTIWFCAFDNKTNEMAAVISVMPKEFILNGKPIRAGILGDFMVGNKYRVFGPNLILPKTVLSNLANLGFKFIYTIPNTESVKLIKRVGFKNAGTLYNMIMPLDTRYYLKKYLNAITAIILAPLLRLGLKIISKETYISATGIFEEAVEIDESFNSLWNNIGQNESNMFGKSGSNYLKWKYFQNPLYKFRILTYRENRKEDLSGFIAFTIDQRRLLIFDLMTVDKKSAYKLLKKIIGIGRNEKCLSVNAEILESNALFPILRSCRFFDAKNYAALYSFGEFDWPSQNCNFFAGDRNI